MPVGNKQKILMEEICQLYDYKKFVYH